MAPSYHMYNNEDVYEGNPVTPVRTLALNSYVRMGYRFAGWNSEPDGSGDFYADGAEIWNLTEDNFSVKSPETGTVVLYAQWEKQESSLVFDAGGGNYRGENPVVRGYGSHYVIDQSPDKVDPPAGYTVYFDAMGGGYVAPVTARYVFLRWDIQGKVCGKLEGNVYQFLGGEGNTDRMAAAYALESVILPVPSKGNAAFGGWFLDPEMTQPAGAGGDAFTPAKSCTLYAKWVELQLKSISNYTANQGKGAADLFWNQPDSTDKTYRLYQSGDSGRTFAQIFSVTKSAAAEKGLDLTVEKPGSSTVEIPSSGFYLLTANGAQGGNCGEYKGGKGGSVSGKFYLKKGEVLTVLTGGQDGTNGGGTATDFGNGGGMTKITSNLKGILLIAGGGGGAVPHTNGQDGGIGNHPVDNGSMGGSGMAGGGGGLSGGMAGEHIVHSHESSCLVTVEEEAPASLYAGFTYSSLNIANPREEYGENYAQVYGWAGTDKGETAWYSFQLGTAGQGFAVPGKGVLSMDVSYSHWGSDAVHYQGADIAIMSSSGQTIAAYTIDSDFWTGSTVSKEVFCRIDEHWNILYDRNVFSKIYSDKYFQGNSVCKAQDYHLHRGGDDHGTPLTVTQSGVLSFDIPEETEEIYIICTISYQGTRSILDGVWGSMRLSGLRYSSSMYQCGYQEGQVISSQPGYGGSSYVNAAYAVTQNYSVGVCSGDGSAQIKADGIGMTESQELKGVAAADREAPYSIAADNIQKEAWGEDGVSVSFEPVEDRGTEYYFKAESYSVLTGQLLCTSNITKNLLITGVRGYLYLVDAQSGTKVTVYNADNRGAPLTEPCILVKLAAYTQYLHIAAVDGAGNLSETVHVEIKSDEQVAWAIATDQIQADSIVGGIDYQNVSPAGASYSYYVRADGAAPFLLSFDSVMHGRASDDYQINWQIFHVKILPEQTQRYSTRIPYTVPVSSEEVLDAAEFIRQSEGGFILRDALYTGAKRSDQGTKVCFFQAFTLDEAYHGRRITVTPTAGASFGDEIQYSDTEEDGSHAVTLIADGRAPVLSGLEAFQTVKLIDRNEGSIVLEIRAEDDLSGIREFYLEIVNKDNGCRERYLPEEDGVIRVEITEDEPIFSGDFTVTGYAVDKVGNSSKEEWFVTEFALNADIRRILSPHDPIYKRGESGVLDIATWGYADKVEVEFPDFLSDYNVSFVYTADPEYKKEEQLQFMVPLDAPEGESFQITVRAYKGDRKLEEHPSIRTLGVEGTILDELRTRLR